MSKLFLDDREFVDTREVFESRVEVVVGHIMRTGLIKSEQIARGEAEHYVLAAVTGERWDVDDDRLTPEQHGLLARLSGPAA